MEVRQELMERETRERLVERGEGTDGRRIDREG